MTSYEAAYYEELRSGSRSSAEVVVPLLMKWVEPESVIDVGCGTGTWLAVFREQGVEEVWGVDGPYVEVSQLEIPEGRFRRHDLETPFTAEKTFDLVVSLEVAEHLSEDAADIFVDTLVGLGPLVLFSAAIPYQGGEQHVNEQWPAYWADRFRDRGYRVIDALRPAIWHHEEVEWWYAQNSMLYAREDELERWPALKERVRGGPPEPEARVHPANYENWIWRAREWRAYHDLVGATPPDSVVLLLDDAKLSRAGPPARTLVPFPETNDAYAGSPPDGETAIRVLQRSREEGDFLALAWPAFWWLDEYPGFANHLRSTCPCVLENERLLLFDLRDS